MVALILGAALLVAGCDSGGYGPELSGRADDAGTTLQMGRDNATVTVPFKADLFTDETSAVPDADRCGAFSPSTNPVLLNTQEGSGEATHLGRFSAVATFCINIGDLLDDDRLTEGESLPFFDVVWTLTAATGDELWLAGDGEVKPSGNPDFDFEFTTPFEITGGTGRFEGASGSGISHSFVDREISRTQHQWSGTLTLPRGR
jgi:hypothetical protein